MDELRLLRRRLNQVLRILDPDVHPRPWRIAAARYHRVAQAISARNRP